MFAAAAVSWLGGGGSRARGDLVSLLAVSALREQLEAEQSGCFGNRFSVLLLYDC
jgi:hypothetical protein